MLSDKVRDTTFIDARGTSKDAALLGPPSVEFAPYGRVPNSRPRKDARQSTIDQDQEFKDFLESLTNPIPRSTSVDQENDAGAKSKEKITVTPLVQFLKDKKANKGKENATPARASKHARQDSKDGKATATLESKSTGSTATPPSPKKRSAQAVRVEQAARDAVKVLNKQAANTAKGTASPSQSTVVAVTTPPTVTPNSTANAALADKKRERGNASAAAKILQRDLGLGGNAGGRGGRRGTPGAAARSAANNASAATKATPGSSQPVIYTNTNTASTNSSGGIASTPTTATVNSAKSPAIPPTGPAAARAPPKAPASSSPIANPINATSASSKPTQSPSTATQAFLKHANPSQGITEPLLEEAFAGFGAINKVEIDKKKGFAYIDFAEPESLQKAIKASPIKVAQGQVVVLERKTGPTLQARNARGGGPMMGNRGGGMPMGGRGGSMRGRGGFGRGSAHTHHVNNVKSTPAANTIADAALTKSATLVSDSKPAENSASQAATTASTTSTAGAGSETQVD